MFVLCTVNITCRLWGCTPTIVTHDCTSVICISPALFNVDRRLLFTTGGSYVFKPRQHHSPNPAFAALLLLLGGVETNSGPAAKLNRKSTSYTTIFSGYLNCRSAASKIAVIHDLINELTFCSYAKHGLLLIHRRLCYEMWRLLDTLHFMSSDPLVLGCQREAADWPLCSDILYQYAFIRSPTTTDRQRLNFSCLESAPPAQR